MRPEVDNLSSLNAVVKLPQNLARYLFPVSLLILLVTGTTARSDEAGLRSGYREISRLHTDSDSIGSKIKIRWNEILLTIGNNDPIMFMYSENREQLTLAHPDGTRYFSFEFRRHKPRIRYRTDNWDIDAAIPVVDVNSEDGLYTRIEKDDRDLFVLPSVLGRYRLSDWEFHLGGWEETDVQPFNYFRHTLYILRTTTAGARYGLFTDHFIELDFRNIVRVYPADYDLEKDEIELAYEQKNLLEYGDRLEWHELSLQLIQTRYPDLDANKIDLTNRFKFKLAGLNHFLTHRLRFTDMITTYREGIYPYSLIETDEEKKDLWQLFEYAGFCRVFGSHFFLSWKYRIEDSLAEDVVLDQEVQFKLVYTF